MKPPHRDLHLPGPCNSQIELPLLTMFGATQQLSSYCRTRPFAGVSQLGQRRPMLLCNSSKGFGAETAKVGTSRHRVSHLQLPYLRPCAQQHHAPAHITHTPPTQDEKPGPSTASADSSVEALESQIVRSGMCLGSRSAAVGATTAAAHALATSQAPAAAGT